MKQNIFSTLFEFFLILILSLTSMSIPFPTSSHIAVGATRAIIITISFIVIKFLVNIAFPNLYLKEESQNEEIDQD